MSCHPVETLCETEDRVEISSPKILAGIRLLDNDCIIACHQVGDHLQTVTFDLVREKNLEGEKMINFT